MIKLELIKEVFLLHSKIQLFEPELVRVEIFNDTSIGRKETEEVVNSVGKLTSFKRVPLLIIVPNHATIFPDARDYSASAEGTRYSIAEGIIATNLAQKLLVNFYLQFNKPVVPSRAFNSEQSAVEWLFMKKASRKGKESAEELS